MGFTKFVQRYIEKFHPEVIREAITSLQDEPDPTYEEIERLLTISMVSSVNKSDNKLLFIAAFIVLYDRKAMMIDSSLKPGYRQLIAKQIGLSNESIGRPISSARWQYEHIPAFRRRVDKLLCEFNKPYRF